MQSSIEAGGCRRHEQRGSVFNEKNKIDVLEGHGKVMVGKKVVVARGKTETEYEAKHVIIATGASFARTSQSASRWKESDWLPQSDDIR